MNEAEKLKRLELPAALPGPNAEQTQAIEEEMGKLLGGEPAVESRVPGEASRYSSSRTPVFRSSSEEARSAFSTKCNRSGAMIFTRNMRSHQQGRKCHP
jgi:hypothetical protein